MDDAERASRDGWGGTGRMSRPGRRQLLAAIAGAVGLAGCSGDIIGTPTDSATPVPVPTARPAPEGRVRTVVTFDSIAPVNLAVGSSGDVYIAMGVSGQIRRLPADRVGETGLTGEATELVAALDAGNGFLYALEAFDGALYAALNSRTEATHGVWRVPLDGDTASRLAPLDTGLRLRGLLADGDRSRLLVTHARRGAISTVGLDGTVSNWLIHELLEAAIRGPTGLVRTGGDVYVTNNERGRVVWVPVDDDGGAGEPDVLVEDGTQLSGASGIAARGRELYVAVANLNRVVRVGSSGIEPLATDDNGLDLPTDVALAPGGESLLVVNFGFEEMVGPTGNTSLVRVTL